MFFGRDKTWLRKFSNENCKKQSISDIKDGDLDKWAKLTEKTDGKHIAEYMAPNLWQDSRASLQTARKIIEHHASPKILESHACQKTITKLRQANIKWGERPKPIRRRGHRTPPAS